MKFSAAILALAALAVCSCSARPRRSCFGCCKAACDKGLFGREERIYHVGEGNKIKR